DSFAVDPPTRASSRVSVASDGTQGNASSGLAFTLTTPALSADGRFVAFQSYASNLVPGDTNGSSDAFIHDRQTGQTARLSVGSDGRQANGPSFAPGLSADGRFAAFMSLAGNLASPCTGGLQIYVKDVLTGRATCLSAAPDGSQGNAESNNPVVTGSGDARFVAFESRATNLIPDKTTT